MPSTRFIRSKAAALLVFSLAAGANAAVPDLQVPGSGPLNVEEVRGDRVTATTDHWRMEFDLRNGGALDSIVFFHGSGKNVLARPFRTYMDAWCDYDAPRTAFRSSRQGNVATLEFTGTLGAPGRIEGPAQFRTVWTISPLTVRVDQTLRLSSDVSVLTVGSALRQCAATSTNTGFARVRRMSRMVARPSRRATARAHGPGPS